MNGAIIAFNPCHACESHDMCSRCELTLRRDGALKTDKWISVEERLPEDVYDSLPIDCIVAAKVGNEMVVDFATRIKFWQYPGRIEKTAWEIMNDWDEGEGCEITHWMPLPEAPKGGAE